MQTGKTIMMGYLAITKILIHIPSNVTISFPRIFLQTVHRQKHQYKRMVTTALFKTKKRNNPKQPMSINRELYEL